MKHLTATSFTIFFLSLLIICQANANNIGQEIGISVNSYNIVLTTPDSLTLTPTIIDDTEEKFSYGIYSTNNAGNHVRVADYRLSGGFSVNVISSNFTNTHNNQYDPVHNVSAITTDTIIPVYDSSTYSVNEIIRFATGEQVKIMEIINPTSIRVHRANNRFAKPEDPTSSIDDLPSSNIINVHNSADYSINQELLMSNDEQVRVLELVDTTHIRVQRGINGTTPSFHGIASGINLPIASGSTIDHIIPYENLAILTLANANTPSTIDTPSTGNYPDGDDSQTVSSSLDCDWDFQSDFYTTCGPIFIDFTGDNNESSQAIDIINGATTTIGGRTGQYWVTPAMKLTIPPGSKAGTYKTTLTFTLIPNS